MQRSHKTNELQLQLETSVFIGQTLVKVLIDVHADKETVKFDWNLRDSLFRDGVNLSNHTKRDVTGQVRKFLFDNGYTQG